MRTLLIIFIIVFSTGKLGFSQSMGDLNIDITELRNYNGKLSIILFNSDDGFPEDEDKACKWQILELKNRSTLFSFKDLPVGEYAYAILHDEDGDGEMDKNLVGIPKEGFGFSNNYRPRVKNPSFSDASFTLKPGENHHKIEMVYYF